LLRVVALGAVWRGLANERTIRGLETKGRLPVKRLHTPHSFFCNLRPLISCRFGEHLVFSKLSYSLTNVGAPWQAGTGGVAV